MLRNEEIDDLIIEIQAHIRYVHRPALKALLLTSTLTLREMLNRVENLERLVQDQERNFNMLRDKYTELVKRQMAQQAVQEQEPYKSYAYDQARWRTDYSPNYFNRRST